MVLWFSSSCGISDLRAGRELTGTPAAYWLTGKDDKPFVGRRLLSLAYASSFLVL